MGFFKRKLGEQLEKRLGNINKKYGFINFDCKFCNYSGLSRKETIKHIETKHADLLKKYDTEKDYYKAVKEGKEKQFRTIKKDKGYVRL